MMRLVLILCVLAAPLAAQVVPQPRPEGLMEPSQDGPPVAADPVAPEFMQLSTLSATEIGAQIGAAIQACWNTGSLSPDAQAIRILVGFDTTPDGEVVRDSIELMEFSGGSEAAAAEAMAVATRAIVRCAALGLDLPAETYPIWQRIELAFEPLEGLVR